MSTPTRGAIARNGLSDEYQRQEQQKSNLILEANLLKQQGLYPQAAHKFATAAAIEEDLAAQLLAANRFEKSFIHHFSALSCWTQAGDLHRALLLGERLSQDETLSQQQRTQVMAYLETLQIRMSQWMRQWTPDLVAAD